MLSLRGAVEGVVAEGVVAPLAPPKVSILATVGALVPQVDSTELSRHGRQLEQTGRSHGIYIYT